VGTVTEIYDYLRLLYARAGIPRCPEHGVELAAQTVSQMVDQILALPEGLRIMLLAPVIQDRKGEHDQVFVDLRNQGLVRARVDGVVRELEEIPQLDPKRKHRIEAVVDRLRVRADAGQRLAESLETALRLSDGLAVLAFMDEPERPEQLFSARLACPHCGYSLQELEPRQFSFNNPAGACPECDGLGVKQFFDPVRIVAHPELSLANGAIRGWDRRSAYYFHMIQSLASAYGFDVETPFAELPEAVRQVILYGSGERKIEFRYLSERGTEMLRRHSFEGILPNLERRHRETDSNLIREELAKFISTRPCPSCGGARLNLAARHVFIEDTSLPALTAWSVRQSQAFFGRLNLPGRRGEIAQRICKEIAQRLDFLVNVGLDYLSLDRSAETLSGGRPSASGWPARSAPAWWG